MKQNTDEWQGVSDGWQSGGGRRLRSRRNKEAKLMEQEFPVLGETAKRPSIAVGSKYAAAVKTEDLKPVEEEHVESGWVQLKRNPTTGKVERRGEPPFDPRADYERRREIGLKNLVDRWQHERDQITDVLDQSSPYWGMQDLRAPLSHADLSESESESEGEVESETDEWSDGVGWASN